MSEITLIHSFTVDWYQVDENNVVVAMGNMTVRKLRVGISLSEQCESFIRSQHVFNPGDRFVIHEVRKNG